MRPLLLYDRHPVPLQAQPASFVIRQFERLRGGSSRTSARKAAWTRGRCRSNGWRWKTRTPAGLRLRGISLTLDTPTCAGETEIRLLTNLKGISALRIGESVPPAVDDPGDFALLKDTHHGQIESLGQPRAALFALCLAMVAGNALAVVRYALTAAPGATVWERWSGYDLADEVATNQRAVAGLISEASWRG